MLTKCMVSSITGSYLELGIFTHMSNELLLFIVTIAYLYEFTVSSGVNILYFTSILVLFWLKGFSTMNTVAVSTSHICIPLTMCG